MFKRKTHAALDLITNGGRGGLLHLEQPADVNLPNSESVGDALTGPSIPLVNLQ